MWAQNYKCTSYSILDTKNKNWISLSNGITSVHVVNLCTKFNLILKGPSLVLLQCIWIIISILVLCSFNILLTVKHVHRKELLIYFVFMYCNNVWQCNMISLLNIHKRKYVYIFSLMLIFVMLMWLHIV